MEKIKSIKQLNKEKDRLKNRQSELKKLIASDWTNLKTAMKPAGIAKRMFEKKESDDKGDKKTAASAFFSAIAARYLLKLIEKAGGFFRK